MEIREAYSFHFVRRYKIDKITVSRYNVFLIAMFNCRYVYYAGSLFNQDIKVRFHIFFIFSLYTGDFKHDGIISYIS